MQKYGVESMKSFLLPNQDGFSLLEVLIAVVVLTVGLLAIGLLQIGAMKANSNANWRTNAVGIAQSYMDDLRGRSLDDDLLVDNGDQGSGLDDGMSVAGSVPLPDNADQSAGTVTVNGQDYTVFWNITDDSPFDGAKTVRLFVYWVDQKFGRSKVVMTTVLGGLY